jgi:hypothetical protein
MKLSDWEEVITECYQSLEGVNAAQSRQKFLLYARGWVCYGSSFFPICTEIPPSGFFELRAQNWYLGVGPNGISIIDRSTSVTPFKNRDTFLRAAGIA